MSLLRFVVFFLIQNLSEGRVWSVPFPAVSENRLHISIELFRRVIPTVVVFTTQRNSQLESYSYVRMRLIIGN